MSVTQPSSILDDVLDVLLAALETREEDIGQQSQGWLSDSWSLLSDGKLTANQFVKLIEVADRLTPDHALLVQAVEVALANQAIAVARLLVREGQRLYPEDTALKHLGHVLAPAKVVSVSESPRHDLAASMVWLKNHSADYVGSWVALENGNLLGTASSRQLLIERLGSTLDTAHVLITWIP
jgi:hypothetical protein